MDQEVENTIALIKAGKQSLDHVFKDQTISGSDVESEEMEESTSEVKTAEEFELELIDTFVQDTKDFKDEMNKITSKLKSQINSLEWQRNLLLVWIGLVMCVLWLFQQAESWSENCYV